MRGNIPTTAAAERLGLHPSRVRALCKTGQIAARKCECGRDWLIKSTELEKFAALDRPAGRPRKETTK